MKDTKVKRAIGVAGIVVLIIFILIVSYLFVNRFGEITKNPHKIREIVVGYGMWGYVVFSLFNIFQIIFAPIPGHVVTISSGILFGFVKGVIITWVSVIIGGSIVMVISRFYGRKMLDYLLDRKAQKFEMTITRKGIPFILLLSIFPNPIGDGLFYLAGLTTIPLRILLPIISMGRLPGIIISVLVGDKLLTAGVAWWILGGAGFLVAITLYLIFGERIELLFDKIIKRYPA